MRIGLAALVLGMLFAFGCGNNKVSLPDIANLVTIKSGIYGQTGSACDSKLGCEGITALVDQPVAVFASLPWQSDELDVGFAITDTRGLFQFELPAGTYFVCTAYENGTDMGWAHPFVPSPGPCERCEYTSCTDAAVASGERVERQMIFSSGAASWTGGTRTYSR